jgi:hypothetical protein
MSIYRIDLKDSNEDRIVFVTAGLLGPRGRGKIAETA